MPVQASGRFGVYVHVPFCERHCPYCDFTVAVVAAPPHARYAERLVAELHARAHHYESRALKTLYFGGGTPSMWCASALRRVRDEVVRVFGPPLETTMEVNPEHATLDRLSRFREAGIDRVSLGVQSFCDQTLLALGRAHRASDAVGAIERARHAGFQRISVDLIHGVAGTPVGSSLRSARTVVEMGHVEHVSVYELTIEPQTAFARRLKRGLISRESEDRRSAQAIAISDLLESSGFERYEVGSYARGAAARSRHNQAYWAGDEYLGLGVGAHGMRVVDGRVERRQGTRSLRHYLDGDDTGVQIEGVHGQDHLRECLMVGVRCRDGLDIHALRRRFPMAERELEVVFEVARRWEAHGRCRVGDARVEMTEEGLHYADTLAIDLFEALDALHAAGAAR